MNIHLTNKAALDPQYPAYRYVWPVAQGRDYSPFFVDCHQSFRVVERPENMQINEILNLGSISIIAK